MDKPGECLVAWGGSPLGTIRVPGDKSISHRALMLASLADGESRITGFLPGQDCLATLSAFRSMGVPIHGPEGDRIWVQGVGKEGLRFPGERLDLGNSGTSLRLLTGLLVGQPFPTELTGDASLRRRPMDRLIRPLAAMGARIQALGEGGCPPLRIKPAAGLQGIHDTLPVASAQVKSAVLLAGLYARGGTCVTEPLPTRDHTERMLQAFQYPISFSGSDTVCLSRGHRLQGVELAIPGDLSSAAFFLVAAAIVPGSELTVEGVGVNPTRRGALDILRAMGAEIEERNPRYLGNEPVADLRVHGRELRGIDIDPKLVPLAIDEFPALFVAAAAARGWTVLRNAAELRVKESDRIGVMAKGLQALGARVDPKEDGLRIEGGSLSGGTVDACNDHRVAMAFAIASVVASGAIIIRGSTSIQTSFPEFPMVAASAGLRLQLSRGD